MEHIGQVLQEIDLVEIEQNSEAMQISKPREEPIGKLLRLLLQMAEMRQADVTQVQLSGYAEELQTVNLHDVQAALKQLGREERVEFEPSFPLLGTVLKRVSAEGVKRLRPPKFVRAATAYQG
jgi:hypothetical protein